MVEAGNRAPAGVGRHAGERFIAGSNRACARLPHSAIREFFWALCGCACVFRELVSQPATRRVRNHCRRRPGIRSRVFSAGGPAFCRLALAGTVTRAVRTRYAEARAAELDFGARFRWTVESGALAACRFGFAADWSCLCRAPSARATPAYNLQKLEISDGRANFKIGDDKTSFAFMQVEGSVEQTAPGTLAVGFDGTTVAKWLSRLQIAGTVRVRGDIAGTSARLQPAHLQMSWKKSSLADVFRLIGGRGFWRSRNIRRGSDRGGVAGCSCWRREWNAGVIGFFP